MYDTSGSGTEQPGKLLPGELVRILEQEILPTVEKPSRYLGNEVNAVVKPVASVEVRIALAFPDLYDSASAISGSTSCTPR